MELKGIKLAKSLGIDHRLFRVGEVSVVNLFSHMAIIELWNMDL